MDQRAEGALRRACVHSSGPSPRGAWRWQGLPWVPRVAEEFLQGSEFSKGLEGAPLWVLPSRELDGGGVQGILAEGPRLHGPRGLHLLWGSGLVSVQPGRTADPIYFLSTAQ